MNSKILIIENDEKQALVYKDYLEMNDCIVLICTDSEEGLKRALNDEVDMVILDTKLAGTDGLTILRMIRQKRQIPVMFISSEGAENDIVRGLGMGADDYMVKPVNMGEMVARVRRHLTRYVTLTGWREIRRDIIEVRNLTIDKTSRRVFISGKEKYFTTKEYDLLEYLASHPNHVYTKEELFQAVWDNEATGDITTVIVHVKKVREKLGDKAGKNRYIDTIWGVGYRFVG